MRRIFPLKSASSANSKSSRPPPGPQPGQHGATAAAAAAAAAAPLPFMKESPRLRAAAAAGVSSRHAPEPSKKNPPSARENKKPSGSEEVNPERAPGGQAPPSAPSGTPPSGDENVDAKVVEKGMIVEPSRIWREGESIRGGAPRQATDLDEPRATRGADSCAVPVDKLPSKRSGLGAVDNVLHERPAGKPAPKSKPATPRAGAAAAAAQDAARSTSAPRGRAQPRGAQLDSGPQVQSMRITRVPDRVFDSATRMSESSRFDLNSSGENFTPRALRAAAALDRQRHPSLPHVRTGNHARAQSYSEHAGGGFGGSVGRQSVTPPTFGRKPPESPRIPAKRESPAAPAAAPPADAAATAAVRAKGHGANKYSGARVVAERLAKAFRGSSKPKDGKALASGDRKLGQSQRMPDHKLLLSMDEPQHRRLSCDASDESSCSEALSVRTELLLPLPRRGDALSRSSRRMHSAAAGATPRNPQRQQQQEHVLTWQEFVTEAAPDRLSVDSSTSSVPPQETRQNNPPRDSSTVAKNSGLGSTTGSKRWASPTPRAAPQEDGNKQTALRPRVPSTPSHHQQEEKEREILKAWLESLKRQSEGMNDDLEMKARMAEQRLSVLNGEQSLIDDPLDFLNELQVNDDPSKSSLAAGINIMHQRIRRMHDEKKRLALEVASEVKRRITERAAAKEVLVMMKREMEACVKVMEKEKLGIQSGMEREMERRDTDWCSKLDSVKTEDEWLRGRVRRLQEENDGLRSELDEVATRENVSREKVKNFEQQMGGHRKRVEGAEQTILDLRQSLVSSCQQARQAESDLDLVRKAYLEKESRSEELQRQVERLQRLCADHECNIVGLQQGLKNGVKISAELNGQTPDAVKSELIRLSVVEKSLRKELQGLRGETNFLRSENMSLSKRLGQGKETDAGSLSQEFQDQLTGLHLRIAETEDKNSVLSSDLQRALEDRDRDREVLNSVQAKLSALEADSKELENDLDREKTKLLEKEREVHRLERRVDGLMKNNQMLQDILAMREKAALMSEEEARDKEKAFKEAHQMEEELRESLQVSARQLSFMSERAELMNEKLQEKDAQLTAVKNESGKKDETIRSLEQSVGDLAKSVDAQNRRIMLLASKNGDLSKHLEAKGKEVDCLHSKIVEDSQIQLNCSEELDHLALQAHDFEQELEGQNLLCKLLRDTLSQREEDLTKRSQEVATLVRSRDSLQAELKTSQSKLKEASQRLAYLEKTVGQTEEKISALRAEKEERLRDLSHLREALPRVEHERDQMQEEAEQIGREALRLSAEVEVLRRKVAELEEDVLVKEGQISILRGTCFGGSK